MADAPPTTPVLTPAQRQRIYLEEQLHLVSIPLSSPRRLLAIVGGPLALGLYWTFLFWEEVKARETYAILTILVSFIGMPLLTIGFLAALRTWYRARLGTEEATVRANELQEELDKNFFTNLVKINFKYIDKYYYQTQVQANKSFLLSAAAATVSLAVLIAGIIMAYRAANVGSAQQWAGITATIAGVLGQFISAVFFYLYNSTITKMSEYHQKLVLTQNLSLALRITEDLRGDEQMKARVRLIDYLATDINTFLTEIPT